MTSPRALCAVLLTLAACDCDRLFAVRTTHHERPSVVGDRAAAPRPVVREPEAPIPEVAAAVAAPPQAPIPMPPPAAVPPIPPPPALAAAPEPAPEQPADDAAPPPPMLPTPRRGPFPIGAGGMHPIHPVGLPGGLRGLGPGMPQVLRPSQVHDAATKQKRP